MSERTVLVAPQTREYVCIGADASLRHPPRTVVLDGTRGECAACALKVQVWEPELPL